MCYLKLLGYPADLSRQGRHPGRDGHRRRFVTSSMHGRHATVENARSARDRVGLLRWPLCLDCMRLEGRSTFGVW